MHGNAACVLHKPEPSQTGGIVRLLVRDYGRTGRGSIGAKPHVAAGPKEYSMSDAVAIMTGAMKPPVEGATGPAIHYTGQEAPQVQ